MLFHLNVLDGTKRYSNRTFLKTWGAFQPYDLSEAEAWEVAVLCRTPGFNVRHIMDVMGWTKRMMQGPVSCVLNHFGSNYGVKEAAKANYQSITFQDGVDWLYAIIEMRPSSFWHGVPDCVVQSLLQMRSNGMYEKDIAKIFDLKPQIVACLWRQKRFEPFTGRDLRKPDWWPFETYWE